MIHKKYSPPRLMKYTDNSKRFKLVKTVFGSKSRNSPITTPLERSEDNIEQLRMQSFSPVLDQKNIFLSFPNNFFDLKSKYMEKVHTDVGEFIKKNNSKRLRILNNVDSIKKKYFDLTKLMISDASFKKKDLYSLNAIKKKHEKNNEFFKAIKENSFTKIQTLLVLYPELVNEVDSTFQTALHWAVRRKQVKLVKYLIESGASSKTKDVTGRTPESIATRCGFSDILLILSKENKILSN